MKMQKIRLLTYAVALLISFIGFYACKKDVSLLSDSSHTDTPVINCSIPSKPYGFIYDGTLDRSCPFDVSNLYPEEYVYLGVSANPNNANQIVYTRLKGKSGTPAEVYVYNLCTQEAKLIANNALHYTPLSWSTKDWIIYNSMDNQIWKVKSNGDSLTQLTNMGGFQNNPQWNTSGNLFIWNSMNIADENGVIVNKIDHIGAFICWYDSLHVLGRPMIPTDNVYSVYKTNVMDGSTEKFAEFTSFYVDKYFKEQDFFVCGKDSTSNDSETGGRYFKQVLYDRKTNTVKYDYGWHQSVNMAYNILSNDKWIMFMSMRDTFTGHPCYTNYRAHIATMNIDGTGLSQVAVP